MTAKERKNHAPKCKAFVSGWSGDCNCGHKARLAGEVLASFQAKRKEPR
jgi:hypothetical protein